jgi:hypothetical protein
VGALELTFWAATNVLGTSKNKHDAIQAIILK